MLSVSTIAILAGIALPFGLRSVAKNDLDTAVFSVVSALERARVNASAGLRDSAWGISIADGSITVFQGSSFASRDANRDEHTAIPQSVNTPSDVQIVFQKSTGEPTAPALLIFKSANDDTRSITISPQGVVSF